MSKRKLTIKEYSKESGLPVKTIRKRMDRGTLPSKRIRGFLWVYPDEDVTEDNVRYKKYLKELENLCDLQEITPLTDEQDKRVMSLINFIQNYEDKHFKI